MKAAAAFRGQPLLVLVGLLGAWLALRVALWEPLTDVGLLSVPRLVAVPAHSEHRPAAKPIRPLFALVDRRAARPDRGPGMYAPDIPRAAREVMSVALAPFPVSLVVVPAAEPPQERSSAIRGAVGHTLLFAAGLSQMELPPSLAAYLQVAQPRPGIPAAAAAVASLPRDTPPATGSRWSADTWLMMRQDTTSAVASGRPSYGRSQAGAVVRYRLAASSAHAPQAYARASSALAGPLERDLVGGLSARPLPRLPLRVAVEARISETGQGTEMRPAAIAVTEFPPMNLPRRLRAEAYVQGGYVGGRYATAFVDGQGRVERTVTTIDEVEVTAGAGVWGGAQKGAARLDIGPTAAVSFRLGDARGRIAADYRFRVAGDAEPQSGPALTLSAGF